MIDLPGGGGKIPINPDYALGVDGDELIFENYMGEKYSYPHIKSP
jgi:lysine 2,3-aminomutase